MAGKNWTSYNIRKLNWLNDTIGFAKVMGPAKPGPIFLDPPVAGRPKEGHVWTVNLTASSFSLKSVFQRSGDRRHDVCFLDVPAIHPGVKDYPDNAIRLFIESVIAHLVTHKENDE